MKELVFFDTKGFFFEIMLIFVEDRGQLGIPKLENFVSPFVSAPAFRYFYRKQEAARHNQTRKLRFPVCFCSRLSLFLQKKKRLT